MSLLAGVLAGILLAGIVIAVVALSHLGEALRDTDPRYHDHSGRKG